MLEITRIRKTFNPGTVHEACALDGLSLTLESGTFLTVVGGNGSGKTTLLNAVAGTFPIDAGKIVLDGTDVSAMPDYKRARLIGRVFQDPMRGTAADMTIEENLALAARRGLKRGLAPAITKRERSEYQEALRQLDLGLENRMQSLVGLLSGGQRQALTLVMATLRRPAVLLLDEHTAALDPKTAEKVLALSEQLIHEHKLTALMVTHNMRDAIQYGDRLVMMEEGSIIFETEGQAKKNLTPMEMVLRFSESRAAEEQSI